MMKSKVIQLSIAVAIGALCLYFFARGMNWAEVWEAIKQAHYGWVFVAVCLGFVAMFIRALRWQSFLGEPLVSVKKLFMIMNVGFMGNGVLPARMGELIRPLLAGRFTPHRFSAALATIVVERVFDLLGILVCLTFVFIVLPFPDIPNANPDSAAIISPADNGAVHAEVPSDPREWMGELAKLGFLVFIGLFTAIGSMTYAPAWSLKIASFLFKPLPQSLSSKLLGMIESFEHGASTFRRPASFIYCLVLTIALWLTISFSELVVLWAFGIHSVSFVGAMFIMSALCFAVMFPQAPGYIGVYHYALKLVLVNTFLLDGDNAGAISLVMWLTQIPPVIVAGFICLVLLGVSFDEIRHAGDATQAAQSGDEVGQAE